MNRPPRLTDAEAMLLVELADPDMPVLADARMTDGEIETMYLLLGRGLVQPAWVPTPAGEAMARRVAGRRKRTA